MTDTVWEVSKYDYNNLQTDYLLYLLHKMDWEKVFMLVNNNEAFHKMVYKMRDRNIMISPELNENWEVTNKFPYLENVTIPDDFPVEFRRAIENLRGIKRLQVNSSELTIDYITSSTLQEVEVATKNQTYESLTIDHLIHILRINRGIKRLVYTHGFLSNKSINYMKANRIECLKLGDIQTEHSTILNKYLSQNTMLKKFSLIGFNSEYMQSIVFMNNLTDMNHITKLTVHVLDTEKIDYASIKNYRGLKGISLYFAYGSMAELNVLKILNIIQNVTCLQRIHIYRIGNSSTPNDQTHSFFHDEINFCIDQFRSIGIDVKTCTRRY